MPAPAPHPACRYGHVRTTTASAGKVSYVINDITAASRRDRRRAARTTLAKANAGSAGRTTAAVLAASGLLFSTGAAANATEGNSETPESSTFELPVSELTVERVSHTAPEAPAADTDVELSFDRPVVTSEASPERVAAEEAAEVEAEAAAQAQQEAEAAAEAQAAEEAQAQQEAEAVAEAQAAEEAQAQQEAEAAAEAQAQQESQTQEQAQPAQQSQTQSQSETQSQQSQAQPAQRDRQSTPSNDGPSTAGQSDSEPASSGGGSSSIVSAAYAAVGSPYSWGGTSPSGFDCSGMINWVYAQAGQGGLPRTTHGMASLPQVSSPKPGDIVLANGNSHGAIYIGNGQVISATTSGGVRVHGLHESWHNVTTYHRAG